MTLVSLSILALAGCAAVPTAFIPEPLPEPTPLEATKSDLPESGELAESFTRTQRLPALGVPGWMPDKEASWGKIDLPEGLYDLSVEAMPLIEFIHVALGEVLGLTYEIDSEVASRKDPVTLRVSKPVGAQRMLSMVEQVMATYQIGLALDKGSLRVLPAKKLREMPPSPISRGESIAGGLGQVMTIIPLYYSDPGEVLNFVRHFIQVGQGGDVQALKRLNALLVIGKATSVERFKSAVSMVDRPAMAGQSLQLIRAIYWQPSDIAPLLKDALKLNGVGVAAAAGDAGVYINPIDPLNAVLVAAPNKKTIDWIIEWVDQLDTPEVAGESLQNFVYRVKHSTAAELGGILAGVIGEVVEGDERSDGRPESLDELPTNVSKARRAPLDAANGDVSNLRIVIDEPHNSLIFVGSAQDYRTAYQLLQQLDVPAKQVLLEVTIADVSLDKSNQLGIEWQDRNFGSDGILDSTASTLGGLGIGGAGLTLTAFDSTGEIRARLNALASKGDAKILSSPKLLAVDNEQARIQVGTQIAVITGEIADAASASDAGVVRSFEYVDTGVILQFTPTVMANGVVRLSIYQEVSTPGASNNNTPPIAKRTVETTLVAESGQTIMLGGLITRNTTKQDTQVPLFGDIPVLGALFRSRQTTDNSTEMIIVITPHVIESALQAIELTESYRSRLDF